MTATERRRDAMPPLLPQYSGRGECHSSAASAVGDAEEGPLWKTIKKQLYRSEVSHIKRLVGEILIQQNRTMWDELSSLRQILTDFQEQNDKLAEGMVEQALICDTKHRDLMRRQAMIVIEDVRSQAMAAGQALEDLLPELNDPQLRSFLVSRDQPRMFSRSKSELLGFSIPATPSTRPSTSSGCSTPEPGCGVLAMSLGRPLGVDELGSVAEGIREALEAEHDALLASIGEQMERLEAEDARRTETIGLGPRGEPCTAKLQDFMHKLQGLAACPSLRALSVAGPPSNERGYDGFDDSGEAPQAVPIVGGASVRRLQALIAARRRNMPASRPDLGAVPETALAAAVGLSPGGMPGSNSGFDPFFDDPFA